MKTNLNSLTKLKNPEKYKNLTESLNSNKTILQEKIDKYSKDEHFDQILIEYNKNKTEVDLFRNLIQNDELLMTDILTALKKNQDNFNKNKTVKDVSVMLGIESTIEVRSALQGINEVYAKVQDNSNIIIFYDIGNKKFTQKKTGLNFAARCFSYFKNNSIYISGGKLDKTGLTTFTRLNININFDEIVFEEFKLEPMSNGRYSHSMIAYKDYLLAISGSSLSSEIYDIAKNQWFELPKLPSLYLNPTLCINNDNLYMFSGSVSVNTIDRIYKISLNNIAKILSEKGWEDVMYWENIDYYFSTFGRLRRGMTALDLGTSIILIGGFDNDNIYDSMYKFELKKRKPNQSEEQEDENILCIEALDDTLPIKTFFNSNIIKFDNHLVMIDGFNNAIELDLKTMDFYYYT